MARDLARLWNNSGCRTICPTCLADLHVMHASHASQQDTLTQELRFLLELASFPRVTRSKNGSAVGCLLQDMKPQAGFGVQATNPKHTQPSVEPSNLLRTFGGGGGWGGGGAPCNTAVR